MSTLRGSRLGDPDCRKADSNRVGDSLSSNVDEHCIDNVRSCALSRLSVFLTLLAISFPQSANDAPEVGSMLTRRFPMLRPGSRVLAVTPSAGGADVTADLRAAAQDLAAATALLARAKAAKDFEERRRAREAPCAPLSSAGHFSTFVRCFRAFR